MRKQILIALYIVIQKKCANFLDENNIKTTKREDAFKGYASTSNVEILDSCNPELQLKDTEPAVKVS